MLALLPAIVDMFLWKVSQEWDDWKRDGPIDENRVKALQRMFDSFLSDLNSFAENDTPIQKSLRSYIPSAIEPLPSSVRKVVTRLASHLVEMLESCPSSSDISKQFHLDSPILSRLITRRYLSSDLASILARHAEMHDIDLDARQWHQFVLTAIEVGNRNDIAKYHSKKAEALLRPETTSTPSHSDGEDLLEEHEGSRNCGSSGAQELGKKRRLRHVANQISEMVISQDSQTLDELLETLEPYLDLSQNHYHPELDHDDDGNPEPAIDNDGENENGRYSAFVPRRYNPHSIVQYAWSTLLHRSSRDPNITTEALLHMADTLPNPALVGHTLTPVMHGLVKRGEPLKAWELWLDLIEREKEASLRKGLFIDRVTLGVATEACHAATHSLQAAITLVDTWAYKPRIRPAVPVNSDGSASSTPTRTSLTGTIQLDTQNLNILLNLCRLEDNFSTAFKLWQAALPRYGLYHDDVSLNLLLDIARYSDRDSDLDSRSTFGTGASSTGLDDAEMFRRRLRAMADEFGFGRRSRPELDTSHQLSSEIDVNQADTAHEQPEYSTLRNRSAQWKGDNIYGTALATGPTSVLLDETLDGTARKTSNSRASLPWQQARDIFREVVLGNWPHLESVKSPLELAHTGPLESIVSFFGGSGGARTSPSTTSVVSGEKAVPHAHAHVTTLHIPLVACKYPHIIPTSSTFRSYIALLGYNNLHSDIPVALAWMKELGIKPNWSTMCLALLHICEAEGPRRWVKGFGGKSKSASNSKSESKDDAGPHSDGVNAEGAEDRDLDSDSDSETDVARSGYGLARDEEIVRRWLQDWLGHGWEKDNDSEVSGEKDEKKTNQKKRRRIVPTEQDVASSRRWLAQRRKRLTA
ncbi:hypothetical protein IAU59_003600 [Kwoniella sp. CBS 9459]